MSYVGQTLPVDRFAGYVTDSFTGDGSTVAFTLTREPHSESALIVVINNVIQQPTEDYTVSGTTLTIDAAVASGDVIYATHTAGVLPVADASSLASNILTQQTDIGANIVDADLFLIDDGAGGTLRKTAASRLKTYIGGSDPASADGDSLGTASLEWSDLYLADGGIVYFGNDQEVTLTHNADKGLILKHTATADDKPVSLTLQTGETDMAADDVIGKIAFQAPDEGTGTDAILVSGAIQAVAEGNHSSSSNATSLQFMTGASEAATAKMHIKSDGKVGIGTDSPTKTLGIGGDGLVSLEGSSNALTFYDSAALKAYITSQSFGDHNGDGLGLVTSGDEPIKFICNGATQWTIETTGHLIPGANDHGIYLGVSSATASNLLDDYEEGTWTPVWGSTGSYSGQGYDTQSGYYTKIGRQVTIHCYIDLNDAGTVGDFSTIFGLPFTPAATSVGSVDLSIANVTYPTDHIPTATWYTGGSARIYLMMCDGGAQDQVVSSTVGDDGRLYITATFLV